MVQSYYPSYLKLMKPYYPSYLKLMKPLLQRSRCNYGTASTTSRSSLDSFWIWSSLRPFVSGHDSDGDSATLYLYARLRMDACTLPTY